MDTLRDKEILKRKLKKEKFLKNLNSKSKIFLNIDLKRIIKKIKFQNEKNKYNSKLSQWRKVFR